MATSYSRRGEPAGFAIEGSAWCRDDVEAVVSAEERATGLWSAATSAASLCKWCRPLFTDGVYVSVKTGASSGAVFLTP